MTPTGIKAAATAALLALAWAAAAQAQSAAEFYKGRTVEIYIGYGVGGTYGKTANAMAAHLKPRIGADSIVVKTMPGSGGLKMTNYYHNVAPRDGSAIILPPGTVVLTQLLKPKASRYRSQDWQWLGAVVRMNSLAAIRADSGIRSWEDMKSREVIFGSSGVGSQTFQLPALFNGLLGTRIKIVKGYKGSRKMLLAVEQNEIQGLNLAELAWTTDRKNWFDKNFVVPLIQMGPEASPDFPGVPRFADLVEPGDRPIVTFMNSLVTVGRSFAVPADAPGDRAAFLADAIADVARDPAFVAEMEKSKLKVTWSSGADLRKSVVDSIATGPEVIDRIRTVFKGAGS